ncbi:MAG: glyoxalase [Gammaproteobacteria bacterium]|nr:MAG: glyoxalase [Gammaproteobacteria bacterium]PHR84761.1 MAG: glyoxalase [Colwellia sp.]
MKKRSQYCFAALLPLLLSSTLLSAAEPEQPKKQVIEQAQQGKIIWADLYTGDVKASLNFYTDTFGWTVRKFGEKNDRYHLLFDGDQAIAGILAHSAQRNKTETALWIGSISTNNLQARITNAANNNATILLKPHDFALYGTRAVIADPQGGVIALLDISGADKAQQKISHKWNWSQLFSIDPKKAASFYQNTFNYTVEEIAQNKSSYYLSQQNEVMASIVKLPKSFEQRDRWVNFIEVNNLVNTLATATKNGAVVIYQPEDSSLAIIADPNGALLGLTEQESE